MLMKNKQPENIEEAYEDFRLLLFEIAHKITAQYGGEFDDTIGLANLRFTLAYKSFDPSKGMKFSNWMHIVVWGGLKNYLRLCRRHQKEHLKPLPTETNLFNMTDFLDELTEDAQYIVELLFDTPRDLTHLFLIHEGTAHQNKRVIRQYLRKQKWTKKRIDKSFTNIKLALQ